MTDTCKIILDYIAYIEFRKHTLCLAQKTLKFSSSRRHPTIQTSKLTQDGIHCAHDVLQYQVDLTSCNFLKIKSKQVLQRTHSLSR